MENRAEKLSVKTTIDIIGMDDKILENIARQELTRKIAEFLYTELYRLPVKLTNEINETTGGMDYELSLNIISNEELEKLEKIDAIHGRLNDILERIDTIHMKGGYSIENSKS